MKKVVVVIILFILFIAPLGLISYVSYLEMKKYEPEEIMKVQEKSYGEPVLITRTNMSETFELNGTFISQTYNFVELNNKSGDIVKTLVSYNDEVKKGDVLAYINNTPVLSPVNGIITDLRAEQENGFIKLLDIEDLLFECVIDSSLILTTSDVYSTENGLSVQLVSLSNVAAKTGRKACFKVSGGNFLYGETTNLTVYTGVVYENVLVINRSCIYQKEKGGQYYIRRVDVGGVVIGEYPVRIGISNNDMVCISDVEEGWFCDPGYAKFITGESSN